MITSFNETVMTVKIIFRKITAFLKCSLKIGWQFGLC